MHELLLVQHVQLHHVTTARAKTPTENFLACAVPQLSLKTLWVYLNFGSCGLKPQLYPRNPKPQPLNRSTQSPESCRGLRHWRTVSNGALIHVYMHIYIHIYIYLFIRLCMYMSVFLSICLSVCLYVCMHAGKYIEALTYTYVCMYVYTHIQNPSCNYMVWVSSRSKARYGHVAIMQMGRITTSGCSRHEFTHSWTPVIWRAALSLWCMLPESQPERGNMSQVLNPKSMIVPF